MSQTPVPEPSSRPVLTGAEHVAPTAPPPIAWTWLLVPLAGVLLLHLVVPGRYGIGWDELYYVACADHLDWGYVDHPPLIAAIVAATRSVLGDTLPALRFPALLAGLTSALVTGLIAREMGAGRFGQLLASLCVALAPSCAANHHILSMNPSDHLFWTLAILLAVRILGRSEPRLWPVFGLVVGLGLLNKYSIGFLCAALGLGLLLTPARRHLLDRRFWAGAAIAIVIVLPHLAWQARHDWASLEFMRNVALRKNLPLSVLEFSRQSVLMMNALTVPIWATGLGLHAPTQLPIYFAAMHGFEDRVRAVARAYSSLPEGERGKAAIYGAGYGNAAAVDYFGRRYGLPKAIGGHNSYWLWGPGGYTGEVVITIGAAQRDLEGVFEEVRLVEVVNSPYAQDRDVAVHLCRRMKEPMSVLWPRVRVYI